MLLVGALTAPDGEQWETEPSKWMSPRELHV